jgi:hypothetical protein
MQDQDEEMEDIENRIPANNIILNKQKAELKIVQQRTDTEGFLETNIELVALPREPTVAVTSASPIYQQSVLRAICLSIEDLKFNCSYESDRDCWRFRNILFKSVLLLGRVTVKSESTKNERSFYTISIDDETECIDGFLNKSTQQETSKHKQSMTLKKKELERRGKETGINLRGTHYSTDSTECLTFLSNLKDLQGMIQSNFKAKERHFSLGVINEDCLLYAFPFISPNSESIRLHVFDLARCNSLTETLAWKRNLNRLYSEWYYKQ